MVVFSGAQSHLFILCLCLVAVCCQQVILRNDHERYEIEQQLIQLSLNDEVPSLNTEQSGGQSDVRLNGADLFDSQSVKAWELLTQLAQNSPQQDAASLYAQQLVELSRENFTEFLDRTEFKYSYTDGDQQSDSQENVVDSDDDQLVLKKRVQALPQIEQHRKAELTLYASLAASSYCMSWNLYPQWKCGYPRCKNGDLTMDAIRDPSSNATQSSQSSPPFSSGGAAQQDILASTKSHMYFHGKSSGMTGYIATNSLLDQHHSQDGYDVDQYPGYKKKTIVIAFRGSMNLKNFVHDLKFSLLEYIYPEGPQHNRIHLGFWKVWTDVQDQIVDSISEVMKQELAEQPLNSPKVWFEFILTGHSLGGAAAIIGALELRRYAVQGRFPVLKNLLGHDGGYAFYENAAVSFRTYTFGEPRVGNAVFASWLMKMKNFPVQRTTYYSDLVTHLPPRKAFPIIIGKYKTYLHHTAESFIVKSMDQVWSCDGHGDLSGKLKGSDDELYPQENVLCSSGIKNLNIFSHLTYFHILFGPWC
ncbi:hypothetical protein MIR68_007553 [Amoeboaphelidium protococcarum]|nr:hypothetical protein MIR68_007553 [Amoeboaphelidium protococcarum]